MFGKGPGGWDSLDSWDSWDGWDSWDQQINRQLEAQFGYIIYIYIFFNIFSLSIVSLPYQNFVHIMVRSNLFQSTNIGVLFILIGRMQKLRPRFNTFIISTVGIILE